MHTALLQMYDPWLGCVFQRLGSVTRICETFSARGNRETPPHPQGHLAGSSHSALQVCGAGPEPCSSPHWASSTLPVPPHCLHDPLCIAKRQREPAGIEITDPARYPVWSPSWPSFCKSLAALFVLQLNARCWDRYSLVLWRLRQMFFASSPPLSSPWLLQTIVWRANLFSRWECRSSQPSFQWRQQPD